DHAKPAGHPVGGLATSQGAKGGKSGACGAEGGQQRLPSRHGGSRAHARLARRLLGRCAGRVQVSCRTGSGEGLMSKTVSPAPVRRSVTVNVPQDKAFEVFTSGLSRWWPS